MKNTIDCRQYDSPSVEGIEFEAGAPLCISAFDAFLTYGQEGEPGAPFDDRGELEF